MSRREDIEAFNETQIADMVDRVHAAQVATLGIAGAHRPSDIYESIKMRVEYHKEYLDTEFFMGPGFVMYVNRTAGPWPTFTFYVTATGNLYVRPQEDS